MALMYINLNLKICMYILQAAGLGLQIR